MISRLLLSFQPGCSCSSRASIAYRALAVFLCVIVISGEPSKVTGHKDEILGSVKSSVGGLLHNDEMKAKGDAQHASGVTEVNAAVAKQKADAAVEGGKGNIKSVVGSLTGNDKMVSCSVEAPCKPLCIAAFDSLHLQSHCNHIVCCTNRLIY
jgi:uncharacterized protein YjbJ (UPF0337 family)